jgi:phosphoribosylformylglycinamidine synthase
MIYRVDVYGCPDVSKTDPAGEGIRKQLAAAGIESGPIETRKIYLIDADATREQINAITYKLLADPVADHADLFDAPPAKPDGSLIEVHLKPGVMDPVATSMENALRDLGIKVNEVRTGRAFHFGKSLDKSQLESIARRYLANSVIEKIVFEPQLPSAFAHAQVATFAIRHVPIRKLDDEALKKLSRDGHLFLNLVEMRAVQKYFIDLGREPTDIELETLAQTWSEHCVHKTLKSAVEVVDESGKTLRTYKNLIKETIFASTMELMAGQGRLSGPASSDEAFCLSVFKDNAGVIAFDETDAVCFKVETHNRPSAIEPYGGAATGIGGCIRDVLGTGLGAKPIANTNVFCVAPPDTTNVPAGMIHPKRILEQVVAGVRDYGNRMGIPTVNGAVYFDENYIGNPLVFAGCVGIIPRSMIHKKVNAGDAIVVMGGRTGRDGIHGATFSSAELTSTHADEFSHAVQIGNAITQKKMMDVLLQARDRGLYTAVTDCGAGGLSSAVGEMGGEIGAEVELDKVPLKYAGLRYDEIWISEAQERMVLSVPASKVKELLELSAQENVESTVIGTFGTKDEELILRYSGTEVGRMKMAFLHDGIPMPTRRAVVNERGTGLRHVSEEKNNHLPEAHATKQLLLAKLAHPNIASKHWIIRQYDHEVQGGSVIKPLVGPLQIGPSDASVIRPKISSKKGVVVAGGMNPSIEDPYEMALASIDEAIRNAVCVGARLDSLAILDNFCWPGVHDEVSMGTLVRACEACRDGALGYGIPFISGKDSLHNQFTDAKTGKVTRIPNTLLISAIGVIDDVSKCVTSPFKKAGNPVYRVAPTLDASGGADSQIAKHRAIHQLVSDLIAAGIVKAAHDISDGGTLVAAAEMAIGSGLGVEIRPSRALKEAGLFAEHSAGYLLEIDNARLGDVAPLAGRVDALCERIGTVTVESAVSVENAFTASIDELTKAWRGTLDW